MTPSPAQAQLPAVTIAPDYPSLCDSVAQRIAALVRSKPNATLGLATGSTPLGVYQRLRQLHQLGQLDLTRVTCFNLDEYYPMDPSSPHSYHHFMQQHLFRHVPCPHWNVPDGTPRSPQQIGQDCQAYEDAIRAAGGLDLQLLGVGRTGHIGFNEPGSAPDSRTRLVELAPQTREDAAGDFGGLEFVPRQAVSMGVGTILSAREIVLMASGAAKASVVAEAWDGPVTARVPASFVRTHANAHLCLDSNAAKLLQGVDKNSPG